LWNSFFSYFVTQGYPLMKKCLIASAFALSACATSAFASCNITITVPTSLTPADNLYWAGCGTNGTSVQTALDTVAGQGGGAVMLTGPGTLLVRKPLVVGYATTLYGDSSKPYGMTLVGDSTAANTACASSATTGARTMDCPIVRVPNLSNPPAGGASNNATVWNLKFDGTIAGKLLTAPAVSVESSNSVLVTNTYVTGARYIPYVVSSSPTTTLSYVSADLAKGSGTGSDGTGSGIWVNLSNNTIVDHANIFAVDNYGLGYPTSANPPRDLVAVYGSDNVTVRHSKLMYTNAAAIFINRCDASSTSTCTGNDINRRSSNVTVWDNDVQYTRQHGIDVAYTDTPTIVTNRIADVGHAGIALANIRGGVFSYNTVQRTGNETFYLADQSYGAILVKWGTASMSATGNQIYGNTVSGSTRYSVYFETLAGWPNPVNNALTNNTLWPGTSGYFGGSVSGNITTPNAQN
jgi:hypothetical protein